MKKRSSTICKTTGWLFLLALTVIAGCLPEPVGLDFGDTDDSDSVTGSEDQDTGSEDQDTGSEDKDTDSTTVDTASECVLGVIGENCDTCVRFADATQLSNVQTGLSWANAASSIQDAFDSAAVALADDSSLESCQVWVKNGTYYIYQYSNDDSLYLNAPNIALLGGFTGDEETESQRRPHTVKAILSGFDAAGLSNRVHHVVTVSEDVTVDGFEIVGGAAPIAAVNPPSGTTLDDMEEDLMFHSAIAGGGMLIKEASPIIENVVFRNNRAGSGGAVGILGRGTPSFYNCVFEENNSHFNGGAVLGFYTGKVLFEQCLFDNNGPGTSGLIGGVVDFKESDEFVCSGCRFTHNEGTPTSVFSTFNLERMTLTNMIVASNVATQLGAGGGVLFILGGSGTVNVINSTIVNNSTDIVAPLFKSSDAILKNINVVNSIIWSNENIESCFTGDFDVDITYSNTDCPDVAEDATNHNIEQDPLLTHLFELTQDSPCIDAGDGTLSPEFDIEGHSRVNGQTGESDTDGSYVDLGAYEFQPN